MNCNFLYRSALVIIVYLFSSLYLKAQTISGSSCVNADGITVYDYAIGNWPINGWVYFDVTGGTIISGSEWQGYGESVDNMPIHIQVAFTDAVAGKISVDYQALEEDPQSPGNYIQQQFSHVEFVINQNTLNNDIISAEQIVNYNTIPQSITSQTNLSGTGVTYLYDWEKGDSYFGPFVSTGVGTPQYNFSDKLDKAVFLRRKVTQSCGNIHYQIYSNVIKISIVSINWENYNYVREHNIMVNGISDWKTVDQLPIGQKIQNTTYLDGLERPIEKISRETATPSAGGANWGDKVEILQYDGFGRQSSQYLPYTTLTEIGKFKTSAFTEQPQYYLSNYNETSAYSAVTYDNSPLNRVINLKTPGSSWNNGPGTTNSYDLNTVADNIQIFSIGYNSGDIPVDQGAYPPNTLFKTVQTDENRNISIEFRNYRNELVLRKVQIIQNAGDNHNGWICTYNVYDDFGLLRYVLQPEAVNWLVNNNWSFSGLPGQNVLDQLCFRYEYDAKKRIILKKSPGAKELYTIYDNRDRVVFVQDGNQRAIGQGQWTATVYDELDRPVLTALYNTSKSKGDLETGARTLVTTNVISLTTQGDAINDLVVNKRLTVINTYLAQKTITFAANGGGNFVSGNTDEFTTAIASDVIAPATTATVPIFKSPLTTAELNDPSVTTILKYFFYDDYSYNGSRSFDTDFKNSSINPVNSDPIEFSKRTTGLLTGTKVRILGTNSFLTGTIYYDEKGRQIQSIRDNIKQGQDIATMQYQFDDRVLSVNTKHSTTNSGYDNFSLTTICGFDKLGRIISTAKQAGIDNPIKPISSYEYDDLGRIKIKHLDPFFPKTSGWGDIETLNYSYNLQGLITGINKDYALKTAGKYHLTDHYFGMYLGYDNKDNVFNAPQLDGHVTGIVWTTQGNDAQRKYDFTYDAAGRLTDAFYNEKAKTSDNWNNVKMDFSVLGNNTVDNKISYDLNGNMLGMTQKGAIAGTSAPVDVDKLSYTYEPLSNKLKKIRDNSSIGAANGKLGDFTDGNSGDADDYSYDANGNTVVDMNKGLSMGGINGNAVTYNYLDKPEQIRIPGKGTIQMVYDADGNKLQKKFTPEGSQITGTTSYIGDFVYLEDQVQYINFEEGRIRLITFTYANNGYDEISISGGPALPYNKQMVYDFFVRDYQSNTRAILSEEHHSGYSTCTMEPERASLEEPVFGQVDGNGNVSANNEVKARFAVADIPGQANGNGWQGNTSHYVSRLGNLTGQKIGPNVLLKVMSGDYVESRVAAFYKNAVTNQNNGSSLVNDIISNFVQAISGSSYTGAIHGSSSLPDLSSQLISNSSFNAIADPDALNNNGGTPKAYLSVLFFDDQFNFIPPPHSFNNTMRVGGVSGTASNISSSLEVDNTAPKNGYAYIYVSNSSDEMVYFDNLYATITHGPLIEEDNYYPFGLKAAGLSSHSMPDLGEGHIDNPNLYNDKELIEESDLNWYDYGYRNYDPQIARFQQLDPLASAYPNYTPYQFAGNEPVANVDLDGLEPLNTVAEASTEGGRDFLLLGGNIGSTYHFLGDLGNESSSWVATLSKVTITARSTKNITAAGIKSLLDAAGRSIVQTSKVLDNTNLKPTIVIQASTEQRSRLTVVIHDRRDPDPLHHIIFGDYRIGKDHLSHAGGFWAWQFGRQTIDEDNAFWLAMMPLPKFGMLLSGVGKTGEIVAEEAVGAAEDGGLQLFKFGSEESTSLAWKNGDRFLRLPNKGSFKLNWKQNSGLLRREMRAGNPIFDSFRLPNGDLIPSRGFLNAERELLKSNGWIYSPIHGAWLPPGL